jgi:hypothetical protein
MEPLLREVFDLLAFHHAPIADEGDLMDAKPGFDLVELGRPGLRIVRIAGKDFDRDRMARLVAEEADDDLPLAFLAIAIIAKGRQFVVCAFQIAARDIIQKQGARLGLSALGIESVLDRSLGASQPIQVLVQRILIKRL